MKVQYFEIVTPDVDRLCAIHSAVTGVSFGKPVAALGNARTADMPDGARIGIRAPMNEGEVPVTRPYYLVDDIEFATLKAEEAGAEIIHPPLEIPGIGKFSICLIGTIQHGYWEL